MKHKWTVTGNQFYNLSNLTYLLKNIIAPRFSARYSKPCQTVMAMFVAFFSAASCLPLSISVIWGGAGWLVGGWDNYRNQISDERRVCLSHDPPFSLFPSCLFYLLSSSAALSQNWTAPASGQICVSLKWSVRFWWLLFKYRRHLSTWRRNRWSQTNIG